MKGNPQTAGHQPVRASTAAFVGTTIEWYDFYIYATAAALVFGKLFFPSVDGFYGTLAAFGTFAVGFFRPPLGRRRLRRPDAHPGHHPGPEVPGPRVAPLALLFSAISLLSMLSMVFLANRRHGGAV